MNKDTFPRVVAAVEDASQHASHGRAIVMCLDGTGDQFDADNSNIVKFFAALKKDDPQRQICYYQAGVGTYTDSYRGKMSGGITAALDMAVGASLGYHVREAYAFLMQNYREGDRICLLGFSRGAYTARALAGMLHKVGLLPCDNQAQVAFAYQWYKDDTPYGWSQSVEFKRTFSIDVTIHFLGCFDTVASVGVIPRVLPFAKTQNDSVRYFRHALALDERRAKFKANHWFQRAKPATAKTTYLSMWDHTKAAIRTGGAIEEPDHPQQRTTRSTAERRRHEQMSSLGGLFDDDDKDRRFFVRPEEEGGGDSRREPRRRGSFFLRRLTSSTNENEGEGEGEGGEPIESVAGEEGKQKEGGKSSLRIGTGRKERSAKAKEQEKLMNEFMALNRQEFGDDFIRETDVLEVWFAGAHADVGGGAVPNQERHMLSRIPLRWMLRQTFACNTGILYHSDVLAEHGLDLPSLWPVLQKKSVPRCDPPPSVLDRVASGETTTLETRRNSMRRKARSTARPDLPWPAASSTATTSNTAATIVEEPESMPSSSATQLSSSSSASPTSASSSSTAVVSFQDFWGKEDASKILPEEFEDYFDCLASLNDQLVQAKGWFILELWPVVYRVHQQGKWIKKVGPNLGRYRTVRDETPKLHWTVETRHRTLRQALKNPKSDNALWDVVA